jgi:hypothetical protein
VVDGYRAGPALRWNGRTISKGSITNLSIDASHKFR